MNSPVGAGKMFGNEKTFKWGSVTIYLHLRQL
jgi:hypothetical protein